jgi:hypothetical protein
VLLRRGRRRASHHRHWRHPRRIIEADQSVELTVFTEGEEGTFDVLDTGKRRNAADVLTIEGEKSTTVLAAMVRTGHAIPRPPAAPDEHPLGVLTTALPRARY